ncbi:Ig lambda chain V-II region MGC [Sciurus carolinensis]|uniref:Ig lambda chain V-II region MGC n=1 Tax=Sciurus carolinensis TaxID=30640 RepID=A0AA41NCY4_SCICA|nr:Ig lambda chain V-II region MGC [Sciurus carolinensis]
MLSTSQSAGIPNCFSDSKIGNMASLSITGLQPEDEVEYYCSTWARSANVHTMLQTHGELIKPNQTNQPALGLR